MEFLVFSELVGTAEIFVADETLETSCVNLFMFGQVRRL